MNKPSREAVRAAMDRMFDWLAEKNHSGEIETWQADAILDGGLEVLREDPAQFVRDWPEENGNDGQGGAVRGTDRQAMARDGGGSLERAPVVAGGTAASGAGDSGGGWRTL